MKRKKYEELTFTDDFMFCKVLVNNLELCRLLLGIKIRKVVNVDKQKSIDITADAKSVRLDVYVEDMRRFLKYLKGGYAEEDSLAGCIEKEVEKAREHLEWRTEYMTLQMRYNEIATEARAEGRAEGQAEVRSEIAKEMLRNNVSIEVIAKCCNMSEEAIRKMADELKSVE